MTHATDSSFTALDRLLDHVSGHNFDDLSNPHITARLLEQLSAHNPAYVSLAQHAYERMEALMQEKRAFDFIKQRYLMSGIILGLLAVQEGAVTENIEHMHVD